MKRVALRRDLKDKICIITGGRTGIGRAIVEEFLRQGACVIVFGRVSHELISSFKKHRALNKKLFLYACDIRDYKQLKVTLAEIILKFEKIDILINNAAVNFMVPAEKMMRNMIDLSVDTNLKGHIYLTSLVGNRMKDQKDIKRVINISAYFGGKGFPGFAHFHACKAGLDAFTRSLAVEWSKYRILVNGISPGPILTENFMHAYSRLERLKGGAGVDSLLKMKEIIPLGHFISKEDVVEGVLFLCSDSSRNITGQTIAIDGGVGIANDYFMRLLNGDI